MDKNLEFVVFISFVVGILHASSVYFLDLFFVCRVPLSYFQDLFWISGLFFMFIMVLGFVLRNVIYDSI